MSYLNIYFFVKIVSIGLEGAMLSQDKHEYLGKIRSILKNYMIKAMDDIGVVMTPFGDVVAVSLVANNYNVVLFCFFRYPQHKE